MSSEIDQIVERARTSGVSMAKVCRRAGVAQSTPARVRKGLWDAKPRTVRALTEALNALIAERVENTKQPRTAGRI